MTDKETENDKDQTVAGVTQVPQAPRAKFDFTSLNTLAVVSLASALSAIGALIAVITGHFALAQIKRSGESGRGLAIAGLVIGYLHLAGWIIFGFIAVIAAVLIDSGMFGLQPFMSEFMDFRRGFDGMHMWQDR